MQALLAALPLARLERHRPSLEDLFIELVDEGSAPRDRAQLRASLQAGAVAVDEEVGR